MRVGIRSDKTVQTTLISATFYYGPIVRYFNISNVILVTGYHLILLTSNR
jgi:hypothetical protein